MDYKEIDIYEKGYKFRYRNLQWEIIQVIDKDRYTKTYLCRNEKRLTECFNALDLRGVAVC